MTPSCESAKTASESTLAHRPPLVYSAAKGRVVILDFWTYCCINCLHVLPELKYLEQKYKDSLTVIGVHLPSLITKRQPKTSVRLSCANIEHPVPVDSGFSLATVCRSCWPVDGN